MRIVAYGTEAMGTLRIEKGHVAGAELDGRPRRGSRPRPPGEPQEGLHRPRRPRSALRESGRQQLVGLAAIDPKQAIPPGAQLVRSGDGTAPQQSQGHVTSTCFSPTLQAEIALGLLAVPRSPCSGDRRRFAAERAGSARARSAAVLYRSGGEPASAPDRSSLGVRDAGVPARWTGNGISIQERPGQGAIALRLRGETEIRLAAAVLPVDFTGPVGRLLGALGARVGLRLGPDEWLILCNRAEEERLTPALQSFVSAHSGSAVGIENGTLSIQCAGSRAHLLLNKGTSLDLHRRSFAPGRCAATGFGKIRVVLWRQELEQFSLHVGRSFARSFWDRLVDRARMGALKPPAQGRGDDHSKRQRVQNQAEAKAVA